MTSSNGNIFRVTGHLCGEFTGPGEFPTQRPVTRSFDVFFDLRLNKRLSKQPWGYWFETPSRSLWRHCNATLFFYFKFWHKYLAEALNGHHEDAILQTPSKSYEWIMVAHYLIRMTCIALDTGHTDEMSPRAKTFGRLRVHSASIWHYIGHNSLRMELLIRSCFTSEHRQPYEHA